MKMFVRFLLVIFCTLSLVNSQGTCAAGWTQWKDEKCYLLTYTYSNFAAAQETCGSLGASLANVKEEEQQTFLTNYLFNTSDADMGVWIGGTRVADSQAGFQWEDGTPFEYANWAAGSPTELARRNCVAMQSRYSKEMEVPGTWKDTTCNSPLYFVCEMEPVWGLDDIKMILIETRKNLGKTSQRLDETSQRLGATSQQLEETKQRLGATNQLLEEKIKNPVPIGYIYTQFPQQPVPSAIWPEVTWTEVTSQFAGQFFRAAGGNAAAFGQTQQADSPRLIQAKVMRATFPLTWNADIVPGRWSRDIESGDFEGDMHTGISFHVSNTEVRPINTAIRIWKRSG